MCMFFFFKQKTAYEMRISDWSSDVCSSDLLVLRRGAEAQAQAVVLPAGAVGRHVGDADQRAAVDDGIARAAAAEDREADADAGADMARADRKSGVQGQSV